MEKLFFSEPELTIIVLLGIISILMFCLLSPNIVMFIHKKWFNWKDEI